MNSVAQRFARGLGGFLIAAAMLSQGAAAGPVRAAPNAPAPKRVALVLIAGLTFDDLQQMPALRDVARKGSTALMSTRTGRAIETPFGEQVADPLSSGYLTMAAGARASGGSEIAGVFSVQDRARAQLWSAYQRDALPETGLAAPWMGAAATQARAAPYEVPIGALGKALREGGIACEIVGVADTPDDVHREAALFALGPDGLAPGARMSGGFVRDEQYPFGVRTPVEELGGSVRQALARARFVVIETGDAARYERCKTDALPAARTRMRKLALDAADAIVRETERALPADALLVVTSPGQLSDPDAAGADRLSPLIVYGAGTPAGLLISASTRRAGVVANTDISASLASWLGVLDRLGPGHAQAIEAAAHPEPLALLKDVHSAAAYQDRTQPAIYKSNFCHPVYYITYRVRFHPVCLRDASGGSGNLARGRVARACSARSVSGGSGGDKPAAVSGGACVRHGGCGTDGGGHCVRATQSLDRRDSGGARRGGNPRGPAAGHPSTSRGLLHDSGRGALLRHR